MLAYHNDAGVKARLLAQLEAHAAADEIVKGCYWSGGKGCAVGCTIHSGEHAQYEAQLGIPQMLAQIEDRIFEGLPLDRARTWPIAFASSIVVGADLSRVGWQFLHWLLTDRAVNPGMDHPLVRDAVRRCADILIPLTEGESVDESAARSAAESAESAEAAAAGAAWAAKAAARSAASAAAGAAAESAWAAARSAAKAAWAAAWSAIAESAAAAESASAAAGAAAESAWSAAGARSAAAAAYVLMADRLLSLLKAATCPV
jgi:hypothetical protein